MRHKLATLIGVVALLGSMLVVANVALAANQAADLDQCANDPQPSLPTNGCSGAAGETSWVNGNLGASKSIYREGDSIAYRMKFSNLNLAPVHSVTIEWDTTKAGKHAIDYLTTWNRTVANSNPCLGVANCVLGTNSTFPIPKDPQVDPGNPVGTGASGGQPAGVFTIWGGTITGVSSYSYSTGTGFTGDKSSSIVISFTAARANPVIAWGGHIATRQAWGASNSAVSISGSPYHTRLLDLDGSGGNQDRSLSADAVIFPAKITVVKHADVPSTTNFSFGGADFTPNPFTLQDNSASTDPSKVSNEILTFGAHTVSETNPLPGYKLGSIVCSSDMTNNYTPTIASGGAGGSVSITLEEGESVICTFNNLAQSSSLSIVKTVTGVDTDTTAPFSVDAAGDVISYSIRVTNTGNTTLTGVFVSDPRISNLDCDPNTVGNQTTGFTLAPAAFITCTGTYTVLQGDLDNNGGGDGDIDNTATADSDQTGPSSSSADVPLVPSNVLAINKTVTTVKNSDGSTDSDGTVDAAGDVVHYQVVVTNNGNTTLTGVTVSDPLISNLDCDAVAAGNQTGPFTLAPGASKTCTGTYTVPQSVLDNNGGGDGDIDNTATADSNETDSVNDSEEVPVAPAPSLSIDKTVTAVKNSDGSTDSDGAADAAGDVIHYSVLVTNTGNVTLTGVSVSDPLINGNLDCDSVTAGQQKTGLTINVGGSITCTGTYTVTQADLNNNGGGDGDIDNTATADSDQTGPKDDSEDVPLAPSPSLSIDKTVSSVKNSDGTTDSDGSADAAGDVINYSVLVTNTGNVTLTGVSVSDPLTNGNLDCDAVTAGQQTSGLTIAVGGSITCTGSYTVTQDDLDNNGGGDGDIDNTATADSNETGPKDDSEDVPVAPDPGYNIVKVDDYADGQKYENVGDVVTYTITVYNTGNTTLVNLVVTDPNAPNIDCSADAGQQTTITIPVGGNVVCSASHEITQDDLDAGHYLNTACVDDGVGGEDEDCDSIDTPGKNQPTINTADVLIPQDSITIAGLTVGAGGTLYVELQINGDCGDANPAYSKSWTGAAFTGNGTYDTANTVAVSTDATIRWCTSYSGDANNAARPLSDRGEVVSVDFDPLLDAAIGAAFPLLAWALWSQRRRKDERDQAA